MRYLLAPLAFLCIFIVSPALAQGGPDSIYVPGKGYVERGYGVPQTRHFGAYTKAPKRLAKKRSATKVAKRSARRAPRTASRTRSVPTSDRTVFTYSLNQMGDVTGFNSASASCLPPSIKSKLTEISRRFGKVTIVSALRRGATIAGSGSPSYHASCRAVDFKVKGNQAGAARWLKDNHEGGVGTYTCAMHHIHIDDGRRARWHHCVNKSGRPIKRRS